MSVKQSALWPLALNYRILLKYKTIFRFGVLLEKITGVAVTNNTGNNKKNNNKSNNIINNDIAH